MESTYETKRHHEGNLRTLLLRSSFHQTTSMFNLETFRSLANLGATSAGIQAQRPFHCSVLRIFRVWVGRPRDNCSIDVEGPVVAPGLAPARSDDLVVPPSYESANKTFTVTGI